MEKIPTAEEFNNDIRYVTYSLDEKLITFAKMHVEAALKAASATDIFWAKFSYKHRAEHDKDSIINSYPLDNIK